MAESGVAELLTQDYSLVLEKAQAREAELVD